MPILQAIPRAAQRNEPWANGAGTTTLILREPDAAQWRIRISVATVASEGPFSELPGTRRTLVPLDAPMTLRFPDGRVQAAERFGTLQFDGAPAPTGLLPEGPTRDFNLMLRGDARGEVLAHTLLDRIPLAHEDHLRWLVYLHSGHATLDAGAGERLALNPQDAALVISNRAPEPALLEGAAEIILVKLYA
ncbi:MAG TPA: HutD family protein [Rhodanobacteraceae bacterium]